MRTRSIACGLLVAACLTAASARASGLPGLLFGTWELDRAESVTRSERFKRTTCTIEPSEDGLKVIYDLVGERGGVIHLEWMGRFDGEDYPVQGVDYVLTNAYTRTGGRAYEVVVKVDGNLAATARTTISPDGRTLTTVTTERDAQGQPVESTVVYRKK